MLLANGLRRRDARALLVGCVIATVLVSPSIAWIVLDTSAWGGDQTQYGRAAIELYATLTQSPTQWPRQLLDVFPSKPNGLIWIGQFFVPLGMTIGSVDMALLLSVAIAQIVTLVLMYRAIWELSTKRTVWIPVVGCLALASAPLFVTFAQYFLVETMQALSVAWFVLIMCCARRWSRALIAAQLIAAAAFAMSTKQIQPVFCLWPGMLALYYLVVPGARSTANRPAPILLPVTLALAAPLAVATVAWYYRNLDATMMHLEAGSYGPGVRAFWGKEDSYLNTVVYWLETAQRALFGPWMWLCWLLVALAVPLYLVARSRPKMRHFTLCAAIGVLQIVTVVLVFSLSPTSRPRYILPALPYFALLLAWSVAQINRLAVSVIAALAFVVQLAVVQAQALDLASWRYAPVRVVDRDARNHRLMNAIVARTCPPGGPFFNILAIDTAISVVPGRDWLGAEQANYAVAKNALLAREAPRCHYGYPGDSFFGSTVQKAWESLLARRATYLVTIDPARYQVPVRVFNEALNRENFPVMLAKVETSGFFEPEAPIAGYPGVLVFRRIDHVARGRELLDAGRRDDAIAVLRRAAELEPSNVEAWANLNFAYSLQGRTQDGIEAGRRGLRLNADHYWLNILTAEMLGQQHQWSDVVPLGERALRGASNPEQRARALTVLGRAYKEIPAR